NKKAFVELLFWKSPAAAREMSEGYGSLREGEGPGRSRAPPWTPQEEQELRELYWKYKEVEGTRAGAGGCSRTRGGLHPRILCSCRL
ncbi:TIM protein, partial [Probosciger aterrimus]|nr:TIM protein [Probosciger aterrimus]